MNGDLSACRSSNGAGADCIVLSCVVMSAPSVVVIVPRFRCQGLEVAIVLENGDSLGGFDLKLFEVGVVGGERGSGHSH